MNADDYKNCFAAARELKANRMSFEQVAKFLNLPESSANARDLNEVLVSQVRDALQPLAGAPSLKKEALNTWRNQLLLEHFVYGHHRKDARIMLDVLERIKSFTGPELTGDPAAWTEAIRRCLVYQRVNGLLHDELPLNELFPQQAHQATSLNLLSKHGCHLQVTGGVPTVTMGLERVHRAIENEIRQMGGIAVAHALFISATDKYNTQFSRHFFVRSHNMMGLTIADIPYGYLLNLCAKHPGNPAAVEPKRFGELLKLATALTNATLGVQDYNLWASITPSPSAQSETFRKTAVWDGVFSIPQVRPATAIRILEVFNAIPEPEFVAAVGATSAQAREVAAAIFEIAGDRRGPVQFTLAEVAAKTRGLTGEQVQLLLDFFTHNGPANTNYVEPAAYTEVSFTGKPLLRVGENWCLMDKSWCAGAFYEALAMPFYQRRNGIDYNAHVGIAIDHLIIQLFAEKNIPVLSGKYLYGNIEGEADGLIETAQRIILLENKRKPITRSARSGNEEAIFIDLANSLVDAQLQAGRTEWILRDQGFIDLKDESGTVTRVHHNGREILRVALSFHEYGGFQDRLVIMHFLELLMSHQVVSHSTDENVVRKFAAVEAARVAFRGYQDRIRQLQASPSDWWFYNCWFISLSHLVEMIGLSQNADEFSQLLKNTQSITLGSMDFLYELQKNLQISGRT